jgi:hypothetical protein
MTVNSFREITFNNVILINVDTKKILIAIWLPSKHSEITTVIDKFINSKTTYPNTGYYNSNSIPFGTIDFNVGVKYYLLKK